MCDSVPSEHTNTVKRRLFLSTTCREEKMLNETNYLKNMIYLHPPVCTVSSLASIKSAGKKTSLLLPGRLGTDTTNY